MRVDHASPDRVLYDVSARRLLWLLLLKRVMRCWVQPGCSRVRLQLAAAALPAVVAAAAAAHQALVLRPAAAAAGAAGQLQARLLQVVVMKCSYLFCWVLCMLHVWQQGASKHHWLCPRVLTRHRLH